MHTHRIPGVQGEGEKEGEEVEVEVASGSTAEQQSRGSRLFQGNKPNIVRFLFSLE